VAFLRGSAAVAGRLAARPIGAHGRARAGAVTRHGRHRVLGRAAEHLVDIDRLPLDSATAVRIGALARMSDVANHPELRRHYPVMFETLLASASPQIRNMATIGGNLLQRTRCGYFRAVGFPCNKRVPGSGCPTINGENRLLAIFGIGDHCVATHASDLAVALAALDAAVELRGAAQTGSPATRWVPPQLLKRSSRPLRTPRLAPGACRCARHHDDVCRRAGSGRQSGRCQRARRTGPSSVPPPRSRMPSTTRRGCACATCRSASRSF
jgi:hypothetical protein